MSVVSLEYVVVVVRPIFSFLFVVFFFNEF